MAIITLGLILWFLSLTGNNMVSIKILLFLSTSSNDYSKNVLLKNTAILYIGPN